MRHAFFRYFNGRRAVRTPAREYHATFPHAGPGTLTENTNRPRGRSTRKTSDISRSYATVVQVPVASSNDSAYEIDSPEITPSNARSDNTPSPELKSWVMNWTRSPGGGLSSCRNRS